MSYFICNKIINGVGGDLYRIAENIEDLNNQNINKDNYLIVEESQENFNAIRLKTKIFLSYDGNNIQFQDYSDLFLKKEEIDAYIKNTKTIITFFLDSNKNHPYYGKWKNYYDQLSNLDTSSISYPLNKSLEQYFDDLNKPSLNPLQIP